MDIKETSVSNFSIYNAAMKKSLLDKIFFMDKIDAEVFVDYGCADGSLIKFLSALFPEYEYYGFDISEEMVKIAKSNNPEMSSNFTTDWAEIEKNISNKKSVIILSSIIHEVYSYGTNSDVDTFWKTIFNEGFSYIVLRDMIPSKTIDRRAEINDVMKIYKKASRNHLYDFETFWGSIENNKNLMHYLLKYRYTENWDREVKEDYMPVTREQLLSAIPDEYEISFHEHFILPFLKNKVYEDFGIELKDNTHLKLILKRNKNDNW